jgi:intraflagellar transport protein 74
MDPARLGTAARMQMGGANANRMTTGMRMTTAAKREANFSGVGQNTQVKVVERPITNHGVGGVLKTAASGPGR